MEKMHIKKMILADDLTGANDTGVHFLSESEEVTVIVDTELELDIRLGETTVINTDTRLLKPEEAYNKIHSLMKTYMPLGPSAIFKKIDSTLRGNVGSEVEALLDFTGCSVACIASASPRNGRTVRNGLCYVNNVLLAETEIAEDPFNPVQISSLSDIIAKQSSRQIAVLELSAIRSTGAEGFKKLSQLLDSGAEIIIADSETSDDLKRVQSLFSRLNRNILYVGSAGLFHAIRDESSHLPKTHIADCGNRSSNMLFIVGSLMGTTQRQVDYLCRNKEVSEFQLKTEELIREDNTAIIRRYAEDAVKGFCGSSIVLLKTDRMKTDVPMASGKVGRALGEIMCEIIRAVDMGAIIVTGGDTALNVLKEMKVSSLKLIDEVLPGIPAARLETVFGNGSLIFVTKAGSYGEEDALKGVADYVQAVCGNIKPKLKIDTRLEWTMKKEFDISFPKRTMFGDGALRKLGRLLAEYRFERSVILMDDGIKRSGIGERVSQELSHAGIEFFVIDDLPREPADTDVDRVISQVKTYKPDNVVAVGGGSVLDVGKLCSVLTKSQSKVIRLLDGEAIPSHTLFTTLIPTTSGTGSEATKNAIIAIPARNTKAAVVHERLLPDFVILDPQLTVRMPVGITAATGMDALCHAMECYLSNKANQMSDLLALHAIELIAKSLRRAAVNGEDIEARSDMLLASYYAGTCISLSGTNAVHALSYPLGTVYHIPHGHSNAVLLPFVMEKNLPSLPEKCERIAVAFGYDQKGASDPVVFLVRELHQLLKDLDINTSLQSFGVKREDVPSLVETAYGNRRLMDNNPVDLTKEEIEDIYYTLLGEAK
ncbi:MAG: iron-containing alcohol dehydrogenase [Spirochaetia bacterium]|nr:iron-containing alcohol dehydrogenase [Spirochaetia bacterium]MCF7945511.1 iron-containing alcohol dehydrogenase [Spirochaetia bacterium]MCF7946812.1 iron-containing alcohol dehydrogenase [Spirochaetia bacterium]